MTFMLSLKGKGNAFFQRKKEKAEANVQYCEAKGKEVIHSLKALDVLMLSNGGVYKY